MVEYDMSDSMRIGVAVTNCTALLEVGLNKYACNVCISFQF